MASILLTVTVWHLVSAANSYQNDRSNDATADHVPQLPPINTMVAGMD
jgi:hypothetical protein